MTLTYTKDPKNPQSCGTMQFRSSEFVEGKVRFLFLEIDRSAALLFSGKLVLDKVKDNAYYDVRRILG